MSAAPNARAIKARAARKRRRIYGGYRFGRPWRDGREPRAQHGREGAPRCRLQPNHRQDRCLYRRSRQPRPAPDRLPQPEGACGRSRAAAPDRHHGPGRHAGRRDGPGARGRTRQGRHADRRRQRQLPRHAPARRRVHDARPRFPRRRRLRRRGGRPPRSLDHGRRHAEGVGARREDHARHLGEVRGRAVRRARRPRRRRPFRQDHPQRHRIRRHADDRRSLRRHARRPRLFAGRDGRHLQHLERRPAEVVSDRDHRQGAGREGHQDRQAAGRGHPRHRRPEGHRPLVGDGGAGSGRPGDRDRSGGFRPRSFGAARPAPRRGEDSSAPHP